MQQIFGFDQPNQVNFLPFSAIFELQFSKLAVELKVLEFKVELVL
jgi:hypothetical protein